MPMSVFRLARHRDTSRVVARGSSAFTPPPTPSRQREPAPGKSPCHGCHRRLLTPKPQWLPTPCSDSTPPDRQGSCPTRTVAWAFSLLVAGPCRASSFRYPVRPKYSPTARRGGSSAAPGTAVQATGMFTMSIRRRIARRGLPLACPRHRCRDRAESTWGCPWS